MPSREPKIRVGIDRVRKERLAGAGRSITTSFYPAVSETFYSIRLAGGRQRWTVAGEFRVAPSELGQGRIGSYR
jgi:hypothetical protein